MGGKGPDGVRRDLDEQDRGLSTPTSTEAGGPRRASETLSTPSACSGELSFDNVGSPAL
jgi:hypothetical protein